MCIRDRLESNPSAAYTRFAFRPGNRGVAALFADWRRAMPLGDASLRTFDYIATPLDALDASRGAGVRVVRGDAEALQRFYASRIPHVELDSLRLDAPSLPGLRAKFARFGLERRRSVYMAVAGEAVVGAAICNFGPLGSNFSFLENAVEGLEISPDVPRSLRVAAFRELMAAAARFYRAHGRSLLVATIGPEYADLAKSLGLVSRKQYTLFTGRNSTEGFVASRECFRRYYRALVLAA